MIVNDALSSILTLQSWSIANSLFVILNATNLFMLMFAVIIFQVWAEVGQEGEDEGNKGLLGLNRAEIRLILACGVFMFAMMPVFPLTVNTLTLDQNKSEQCGVAVSSGHTNSSSSSFNNKQVKVPLWWVFWHAVSQGLTNASVASIPCTYDVSNSLLALSQMSVKSEPLRQELQDFYQQCYTRAYLAMKAGAREGKVTASDYNTANWIGGEYFLTANPAMPSSTYHGLQAENAVFNFPYNPVRDNPIQQRYRRTAVDTTAAYPSCYDWWTSNQVKADGNRAGLRWRTGEHIANQNLPLAKQVLYKGGLFDKLMGNRTTEVERMDMLIERSLSIENLSTGGRVVRGYGQVLDKSWGHELGEVWNLGAGSVGVIFGQILTGPAMFIVRQAMPMLQVILMSFVVIAAPIVLTISAYRVSTLMSLTLTYTGLMFLTFWWELCRSLDSRLLAAVYQNHENLNPITGSLNFMDDMILQLALFILYIMMPAIWFGLLGFAGYKVNALSMDNALNKIGQITYQGSQVAINKAKQVTK